jgi:hypothetical protein
MPAIERPKAKRLRAGKAHRSALLDSLPEEQRPIAEQVVLGGLPAVRQAIEKQNTERSAAGEPAITPGPLLEIAEKLVPKVRAAEWRDRAEAAQRDIDVLDLRDLRSVVSTADAAGKDEDARALAQTLKEGLATRVDAEHAAWLEELTATLDVGRIVRALRVSSRPPKAGAPLPTDIATRLVTGASEALVADAAPERWVAVLDALAFAPVRDRVIPTSLPTELHADVKATVARLATRIPKIAHIFEIEPDRNAPRPKPERRRPPKPKKPAGSDKPRNDKPKGAEAPATDADGAPAPSSGDAAAPLDPEASAAQPVEATVVTDEAPADDAAPADAGEAPTETAPVAEAPADDAAPADVGEAPTETAPAPVAAEFESSEPAAAPEEVAQPAAVVDEPVADAPQLSTDEPAADTSADPEPASPAVPDPEAASQDEQKA